MNKFIKRLISSIKYNWSYLKVLNSPFIGLKLKWYFGKIRHGTPYFLPRRLVKVTKADCEELLEQDIKRCLPKYMIGRTWEYYKNCKKPIPIKYFGFNSTALGWKSKWNDFRYEWSPCYSFVIFGKQLFISVLPNSNNNDDEAMIINNYWEAWLNYEYKTDKNKSKRERLDQLIQNHSCTWTKHINGQYIDTDYYKYIIKDKYFKNTRKHLNENEFIFKFKKAVKNG